MVRITSTCVLSVLLSAPLFSQIARGQVLRAQIQNSQIGRFIEAPRSLQQQLREAERAIEEERFSDAIVRLGDLLAGDAGALTDEDLAGQDFFLDVEDSGARGGDVLLTKSLLRSARDRIGSLPASAMETYRLRYGPLAARMLEQAANSRDWNQVREVRRRYFHTLAGYDASALLAQHEIYSGRALAASLLLDDIVTHAEAVKRLGPEIVMLHAVACRHAGREVPSIDSVAGAMLDIGGEETVAPPANQLEKWVTSRIGQPESIAAKVDNAYPVYGNASNRNGGSAGQMPMSNRRWDLVTTASPRQERDVRQTADALVSNGKLPPPSWIPLRIGDHLLMRTTERLVGVDYRTGKRVWTYPWQTTSAELNDDDQSLDALENENAIGELLKQRVWNDNPYGKVTSDGKRVFMLDSLQKVELIPYGALQMRGTRPADGSSNTLVALDLETEGKLLWRLGRGVEPANELSDAFFLGPPLPVDGRLYVIAELAGDISLFCLDPSDGSELWRQQLVAVESGGIETDAVRRIAGAVPTYQEGVLVCPTGAGAIVAVDISDRMIRWGIAYDRVVGLSRTMISRARGTDTSQLMQRWYSGAAIVSGTTVLVTPIEADRLFGLDLLTGKNQFAKQNRFNMRYLAGARGDYFLIVGTTQVRAYDIRRGNLVWSSPKDMLEPGQLISGVGVFGDGEYLLPTSTNEIIRIAVDNGKVLGRRKTRYPLGNLVAVGGEVISQSPTKLSVAFGEKSLEPLVNEMLQRNPDDLEALIRKSELLIERGDRAQALQLLDRASQMDGENIEVRMLNVAAMLGQLREDPNADAALIDKLDQQIERPEQRVEFLSLLSQAALENQDVVDAVRRLVELSSLLQSNPLLDPTAKETSDATGRTSTLDAWIAARLAEVSVVASESDRATINDYLAEVAESERHGPTGYLEHMVRQFGSWKGIASMRQELLNRLGKNGELLRMERVSLGVKAPSAQGLIEMPPEHKLRLASVYLRGGMPLDALRLISQLPQSSQDFDRLEADRIREAAQSQVINIDWPDTAKLTWGQRRAPIHNIGFNMRPSTTHIQAGDQFAGWTLISDRTSPVALRDPLGLIRHIRGTGAQSQDGSKKQAVISGGFMAVMTPRGLLGVDLFRLQKSNNEAVIWNRSLAAQASPLARPRSKTNPFDDQIFRYFINSPGDVQNPPELKLGPVAGDRVLVLQGGELQAIDVVTAKTLWRNTKAPKSGSIVCDGTRAAVVAPKSRRIDFFDLIDGRKLESKPWTHQEIWETTDRLVLTYQEQANQTTVKLVDPFDDTVRLEYQSVAANRKQIDAPCAYGRVVAGTYMTIMGSNGEAIVWDLRRARAIAKVQVAKYPDLQGLNVVLLRDQIVLLPLRRQTQEKKPKTEQLQTQGGQNHKTVHGAYAINLSDGKLDWQRNFKRAWGCTLTQPADTPILLFSRSFNKFTTRSRRKSIEVLALDVRDGQDIHPAKRKPVRDSVNTLETPMVVNPAQLQVEVNIGPEVLAYRFGTSESKVEETSPE